MNNSSGIYQVDGLLKAKLRGSGLEPYVEVIAHIAMPTSKPVLQYLQRHHAARQIVVDAPGGWQEPTALASEIVHADAAALCRAVGRAVGRRRRSPSPRRGSGGQGAQRPKGVAPGIVVGAREGGWEPSTPRLDHPPPVRRPPADQAEAPGSPAGAAPTTHAREAIAAVLAATDEPFEGRVFAELAELLPDGATLCTPATACRCATWTPSARRRPRGAARARQPRRQRHRRRRVDRARRGRRGGRGRCVLVIGDIVVLPRHERPARREAARRSTRRSCCQQRRRRHLLLPAAGRATPDALRAAVRHAARARLSAGAAAMYGARYRARRRLGRLARRGRARRWRRAGCSVVELPTERARNVALHREPGRRSAAALDGADASRR